MKKRRFWVGLALCLAVCLLPGTAGAASGSGGTETTTETSGTLSGGATWSLPLKATTLTISGSGTISSFSRPEDVPWYDRRGQIQTIEISSGVTAVGPYAFSGCSKLTKVTIPSSVKTIGNYAFQDCTSLRSIDFPIGVSSIGEYAFSGCTALSSVSFPLYLQNIGDYAFSNCKALPSIELRDGLQKIGNNAFSGSGLTSIKIPNSFPAATITIGSYAFYGTRLGSSNNGVLLPPSVKSVDAHAFDNCGTALKIHYGGSSASFKRDTDEVTLITLHASVKAVEEPTVQEFCFNSGEDTKRISHLYCSACGMTLSQTDALAKVNCNEVETVIRPAICGRDGLMRKECSMCHTGEDIVLPKIEGEHDWKVEDDTDNPQNKEATCTATGYQAQIETCAKCKMTQNTGRVIDATGHSECQENQIIRTEISKEATCKDEGTKKQYYMCTKCDQEVFQEVSYQDPDAHVLTEAEITDTATCDTDGVKTTAQKCSVCDQDFSKTEDSPALGHARPDDGYITHVPKQEATCMATGLEDLIYTCTRCKEKYTEENAVIPTKPHTEEAIPDVPANCNEPGLQGGIKCSVCNTIIQEPTETPKDTTKHALQEEELAGSKPATCTEPGVKKVRVTCKFAAICGMEPYETEEEIPALGHDQDKTAEAPEPKYIAPDCTNPGYIITMAICTRHPSEPYELEKKENPDAPATGHKFGEWETIREPTAQNAGVKRRICTVCQEAELLPIPALGNTFTVTLDPNGGALPEGASNRLTTGTDGKLADLPQDPTREGYRFAGWYTEKDNGERVDLSANTFTADTTVYAHWTGGSETPGSAFTVTFDANEGTLTGAASAVTGTDGKLAAPPTDPTRTGYTFDGWYTAKEDGEKVDLTAKVFTADTTVYAHWTAGSETPGVTFTVTLDANGGTLSGGATAATGTDGKLSTLPAAPTRTGYTFDGWYTTATGGEKITTATVFTKDTTVYAHWTAGSGTAYAIRLDSTGNGTISSSVTRAVQGTTVTLYADPDRDYRLSTLVVTDSDGSRVSLTRHSDSRYSFVMPASAVRASATFVWDADSSWNTGNSGSSTTWNTGATATPNPDPAPVKQSVPQASVFSQTFRDIPMSHWAAGEIAWAYERGYMNGTGGGSFSPDRAISHRQLWTVLTRLLSYTNVTDTGLQTIRAGLIDGGNPNAPTTRQELVTALHRCAYLLGGARTPSASLSGYADHGRISGYARDAMAWAVTNGIVSGTADGRLNPGGTVTRAHFAVILYRFSQRI